MAIERTLQDINQTDFDTAESAMISVLREGRPELDLRTGTALRDLLLRTAAQLNAFNQLNITDLRNTFSVLLLSQNPELVEEDTLANITANMGITRREGSAALGVALMTVSQQKNYFIPEGYELTSNNDILFATTANFSVRAFEAPAPPDEIQLFTSASGGFFFLLPIQAVEIGPEGNIEQGTALEITGQQFDGIEAGVAYIDFAGGAGQETTEELLARIPFALSFKALESNASITARLQDQFNSVIAVSPIGFGDPEQLRDKHNVLGVAVGSRVDIYVRTSAEPIVLVLERTATKISNSVYSFSIEAEEAPGLYRIRAITALDAVVPPGSGGGQLPVLGSFPFTDVRSAVNLNTTHHDIDPGNAVVETAYTVFQKSFVTVTDIPPVITGGATTFPDTVPLKVELYVPKDLSVIQSFVDNPAVRNLEADHLVRGAVPCFITVNAVVFKAAAAQLDTEAIVTAVVDFINARNFDRAITTSQISAVLHGFDIRRVKSLELLGRIRGADGVDILLQGAEIDVDAVTNPSVLVSPDTVVFMVDRRNVFISVRDE